jgi:hypothetical protein
MISGLVLKYLNREYFIIRRGYETALPTSTEFNLTVPLKELKRLQKENERLRRAVSDLTLDKLILKEAASGNF